MPQPMEAMLAGWPMMYPEISGAVEQDDDGPDAAASMRSKVIAPLLDSGDIARTLEGSREAYKLWKVSHSGENGDLGTLLAQQDGLDDVLATMFNDHRAALGDAAVKASLESLRLRKIVRRSTIPHRKTWPEESWRQIAHLMTSSELCVAGIVEYLVTGVGKKENVEFLARRGFQYALDAYWDAGYYGQNTTKLEDIPK